MSINALSEIGDRGLIIHSDDKYYAVIEADWRRLPHVSVDANSSDRVNQLVKLKAVVATVEQSIFVDFDRLALLKAPMADATPGQRIAPDVPGNKKAVVIRERDEIYVVDKWEEVDESITEDARVLVNRGAVAAAIPQNNIAVGTFCVLVNFSAIEL